MTIIAKMASTQHGDVSLACFNAQCRGIKFYNLAEVGVEVGGRLLFRRNPYHFKDKNCVEVRLASRSSMMLGHVAADVALSIVAEMPRYIWVSTIMPCTMNVEHRFSVLCFVHVFYMLSACSCMRYHGTTYERLYGMQHCVYVVSTSMWSVVHAVLSLRSHTPGHGMVIEAGGIGRWTLLLPSKDVQIC